jgi:hypothetical protein
MYVMPNSTASGAAPESAQFDFPHSLLELCTHPTAIETWLDDANFDAAGTASRSLSEMMQ